MAKKVKEEALPLEEQKTAKKQVKKTTKPAQKKKIPVPKPKQEPELQEEFEDLIELQPNFDESDAKVWNEKHIDQHHSHSHTYERKNYGQNRQNFHKKKNQGGYGKKTNEWNQPKPLVWRDGNDDPDKRHQHKPFNKNKPFIKHKPFKKDNTTTQGQENSFSKDKARNQNQGHHQVFNKNNNPNKQHQGFSKDNNQSKQDGFGKDNQQGQNNNYGKNKFKFKKKKDNRTWEERKPKFWNEGKSNKRYME